MTTTTDLPSEPVAPSVRPKRGRPIRYIALIAGLTVLGMAGVWRGNQKFAPEMYDRAGAERIAEALALGKNYALYDLNINIREIRDAQIARMKEAPEVVILGASHWQEAHVDLLPGRRAYNAHIHRDYWEDPLAMVEMFLRHDKLPQHMIISVRDNQFTPVAQRKDYLWLPGVPYYRAMAARLDLKPSSALETAPTQRWKELASISMLYGNAARWYKSSVKPHATDKTSLEDMDLLLPGGSIVWSGEHQRLFNPQRAEKLAKAFAEANRNMPPPVDPRGVEAFDKLLTFLKGRNVQVTLAHPPFNPDYFDAIRNTPYFAGMQRVEQLTKSIADKHGLRIIGSFDPAKVGCVDEDFIDAEHANAECLGKLLKQFNVIAPVAQQPAAPNVALRVEMPAMHDQVRQASLQPSAATAAAAAATAVPLVVPRMARSEKAPLNASAGTGTNAGKSTARKSARGAGNAQKPAVATRGPHGKSKPKATASQASVKAKHVACKPVQAGKTDRSKFCARVAVNNKTVR